VTPKEAANRAVAAQGKIDEKNLPKPELSESHEKTDTTWAIAIPKTRIHTLEQLVEYCEIDLKIWKIERFVANKWEVGMKSLVPGAAPMTEPLFQIKAFLVLKVEIRDARKELDELRQKAKGYAPKYPALIKNKQGKTENVIEFSLHDHHFGAQIWSKETGGEDYDLPIAKRTWEQALSGLVTRTSGHAASKALIVLGNDQQNADNRAGTTERGTPQNMDSRYQKVFSISRDCSIWAIDALLGHYGAVDVVIVSGNHDPLSAWHLGDTLSSWYRNCKQVNVDSRPLFRKYYEHGVNMLLFTHGHAGKLEEYGKTMAAEEPGMWGRTVWREAHTGDKHHRRLIEQPGATIRILPSLRPPDSWSSENHFIGSLRAAEAFVWNRSEGLVGTGVYSIFPKAKG
jgi:hypothetical protein